MITGRSLGTTNICGRLSVPMAVALSVLVCLSASAAVEPQRPANVVDDPIDAPELAREMADAVSSLLASITGRLRSGTTFLFRDEERQNFHYFPIPRRGLPVKEMNAAQRALAFALLSTGMSHRGYAKALTIMSLGQILREATPADQQEIYRDSDQYYVTIFGEPSPEGTWGWRVEGFHLSVNITIVGGRWIAVAPSFFGAIPAIVEEGPRRGLQVLRNEEEWARRLAKSLNPEQRKVAFGPLPDFFKETVGGLITANRPRLEPGTPHGLPVSRMTPKQLGLLMDLIGEYAHRHRRKLAERDLEKIAGAGIENIHFSWGGSLEPGEPHHYMIQGPTFVIE